MPDTEVTTKAVRIVTTPAPFYYEEQGGRGAGEPIRTAYESLRGLFSYFAFPRAIAANLLFTIHFSDHLVHTTR